VDFKRALYIFGFDTLYGHTEEELTVKRRKLLKLNHPDNHHKIEYSIDEINQAYKILVDSVHGKSSASTSTESINFSSFRKKRVVKKLNYQDFKQSLNVQNRTIKQLDKDYLLFLLFKFDFTLKRNESVIEKISKEYEVKYENNNTYFLELSLDFELQDVLEINFENEKILNLNLSSVSNLLSLSVNLTLIDDLKLTISIRQDKGIQK
jgi:hypothetical protein